MTVKTLDIDPTKPLDGVPADKSVIRAHWTEIKTKYETLAGLAMRWRGAWVAGTYLSGDVVLHLDSTWYASANITTEVPGTDPEWVAIASSPTDPLPEGTQAIVTRDSTGAAVLSETAADGTVVIDADGLVTAVPKFPADETEFVDVDASRDLAATDAFDRIYTPTGQASRKKHTILKVEATDPNDAVALNVANNCPTIAAVLVVVTGDQVGAVTLTVGGAGTINGGTDPVTILPERMFPISVENPTLTAPIVRTGATMEDGGIQTVSATGTLTYKAHNGRKVLTTGNVTVPNTPGFWCIIKAGGAHTVTHNSLTSAAMATGDEMVVLVGPSNVIDAFLCLNANRVGFS